MTQPVFWALVGMALVVIGLYGLIVHAHLLRKILALNVISSGVFLVFIALARRAPRDGAAISPGPDPVPQAMVLTGIVVAVAATGLAVALIVRLRAMTGRTTLGDEADN
ncbi:MAG: cation:proton antiporter subunit C [Thiohalocapsa sp.]|nr:cation:proton antiporter subunit C [Thiohalocapsa sp.]MCF7991129.1 cation:proton antiporter subunit C [Thiohalocapsa sp.]